MIGVDVGMAFHALRTQKLEASPFSAEIGDRLLPVLIARNVVIKVRLHVLDGEGLLHAGMADIQIML